MTTTTSSKVTLVSAMLVDSTIFRIPGEGWQQQQQRQQQQRQLLLQAQQQQQQQHVCYFNRNLVNVFRF
jgi:hypothetical protein